MLNPRQQRFVGEYLVTLNAAKAAVAAGYSPNGASVKGCNLLANVKVAEEIAKRKEALGRKMEITQEQVLEELRRCGFSNMGDYMRSTPDGDPYLDFSKLTREQTAALSEVTVEDYVEGRGKNARDVKRVRFKLADKLSALEKLGRHIGMFGKEEKQAAVTTNLSINVIQLLQQAAVAAPEKLAKVTE